MSYNNFTIVYPSRCRACELRGVPIEQRTVLLIDYKEHCGNCGNKLGSSDTPNSTLHNFESPILRRIFKNLIVHGEFSIDADAGTQNPLRLICEDEVDGLVTCLIKYNSKLGDLPLEEDRKCARYDRSKIDCKLPSCVESACKSLANIMVENTHGRHTCLFFESASIHRRRKTIRFSWNRRVDKVELFTHCYEQLTLELTWLSRDDSIR